MALVYRPGSSYSRRSISPQSAARTSSTYGIPGPYPNPILVSPPVHIHDNSTFPPEPDRALFDHAWGRVRQHTGGAPFGTGGVGLRDAKRWHRRAYGRSGEIDRMSPPEIGHAAAYEAFRQWLHDTPSYDPIDSDRQRSSLIALAVAESSRLLQYLPYKATDGYSRTVASESAAFTASNLFYESRDDGYRSRFDRDAWSSSDEYYTEDYYDDYRRSRSHSRPRLSRSLSRHRSAYLPPTQPQILPMGATNYMNSAVPGITSGYSAQAMHPYGTTYGTHGAYIPPPVQSAIYPSAPITSNHAYPGSSVPVVISAGASMHHPQYAQSIYPGTTAQGQVIVLPPQRVHKHHRHHRRSRSRSTSSERPYNPYAAGVRY